MGKMLTLIFASMCALANAQDEVKKISDHAALVGRTLNAGDGISEVTKKELKETLEKQSFFANPLDRFKKLLWGESVQISVKNPTGAVKNSSVTPQKVVSDLGTYKESKVTRLFRGESGVKQEAARWKLDLASKGTQGKGTMIATADGRAVCTADTSVPIKLFEKMCKLEDTNAQLQSKVSQLQEEAARPGVVKEAAQHIADTVKSRTQHVTQNSRAAKLGAVLCGSLGAGALWNNYAEHTVQVPVPNDTKLTEGGSWLTRGRAKVLLGVMLTGMGMHTVYENQKAIQGFVHQKMNMRPQVVDIVKLAQGNRQKMIIDLRKYNYKQGDINASELVGYGINMKSAKNIIMSLEV